MSKSIVLKSWLPVKYGTSLLSILRDVIRDCGGSLRLDAIMLALQEYVVGTVTEEEVLRTLRNSEELFYTPSRRWELPA